MQPCCPCCSRGPRQRSGHRLLLRLRHQAHGSPKGARVSHDDKGCMPLASLLPKKESPGARNAPPLPLTGGVQGAQRAGGPGGRRRHRAAAPQLQARGCPRMQGAPGADSQADLCTTRPPLALCSNRVLAHLPYMVVLDHGKKAVVIAIRCVGPGWVPQACVCVGAQAARAACWLLASLAQLCCCSPGRRGTISAADIVTDAVRASSQRTFVAREQSLFDPNKGTHNKAPLLSICWFSCSSALLRLLQIVYPEPLDAWLPEDIKEVRSAGTATCMCSEVGRSAAVWPHLQAIALPHHATACLLCRSNWRSRRSRTRECWRRPRPSLRT